MIKLDNLTVLFIYLVVAASIVTPVVSVTRLGAGVDVVGLIETFFFKEISISTVGRQLYGLHEQIVVRGTPTVL